MDSYFTFVILILQMFCVSLWVEVSVASVAFVFFPIHFNPLLASLINCKRSSKFSMRMKSLLLADQLCADEVRWENTDFFWGKNTIFLEHRVVVDCSRMSRGPRLFDRSL